MKVEEFRPDDIVRCSYRTPWTGIVIRVTKRKNTSPIVLVYRKWDRSGNLMRSCNGLVKDLDVHWFRKLDPSEVKQLQDVPEFPLFADCGPHGSE